MIMLIFAQIDAAPAYDVKPIVIRYHGNRDKSCCMCFTLDSECAAAFENHATQIWKALKYVHQPSVMELLYNLTSTSHVGTFNLACTDFEHYQANVRGTIYKRSSWTIYSCKGQMLFVWSLHLLLIVCTYTIGYGGQKDVSQGQITFILPVQKECVGVLRADEVWFERVREWEESVWEREVQQRQTIWQCMTGLPFEKSKNSVKLCFFKTNAIGVMC